MDDPVMWFDPHHLYSRRKLETLEMLIAELPILAGSYLGIRKHSQTAKGEDHHR